MTNRLTGLDGYVPAFFFMTASNKLRLALKMWPAGLVCRDSKCVHGPMVKNVSPSLRRARW